jgi:NADPH:quinone reductase-like Zn-dependent oxidoreductase
LTGRDADFASAIHDMTGSRGADVILDLVGADFFEQNLESLAVKGRLILVGLQSGSATRFDLEASLVKRLKIIGTVLRGRTIEEKALATRRFAEDVLPLLASGAVRPNVDRIFKADEVREAHQYLESNASFGKIILEF